MKKILFASSEAVPFLKTGGLADVVGSLPKYFPKEEYDVRVVMPKYLCMKQKFTRQLEWVGSCKVDLNWRVQYAGVFRAVADGVVFYLIDNEYYFAGPAPYGEIYQDAEKFSFFSKAVLTILPLVDFKPDLIHCHDWQTGLIPAFLDAQFREDDFYRDIRTAFTIHNLKFQGRWHVDAIRDITGLPQEYFTPDTMECYGQACMLKGGLVFSDRITTVSETYAKEIRSPEGGEGLDGLLRWRADHLSGIVNGLDYADQNPETDPRIAFRLEGDIPAYKAKNKADLQRSLGLDEEPGAFLIGMVSRLTGQKGFDLVDAVMDEILQSLDVQIVVLGTGEERYESMFRFFAGKYAGRVSANIFYSEELAQKIYASCDAFLMPSLFEPCGLSQLMSLRYGTVPLVRATGGLKDTVEPYQAGTDTGTGFSFTPYQAHAMLDMIRSAESVYREQPGAWRGIVERGMAMDYSWKASAGKYARLYEQIQEEAEIAAHRRKRMAEMEVWRAAVAAQAAKKS